MTRRLAAGGLHDHLLSTRQLLVLQLAWEGCSVKETAARLGLSDKTVKNYRSHIYEKWAVRNVEGMLRQGVERGWIGVGSVMTVNGEGMEWPG